MTTTTGLRTQPVDYASAAVADRMRELFGDAKAVLYDTLVDGFDAELLSRRVLGKQDVLFVLTTSEAEAVAVHLAEPVVQYRPPLSEPNSIDEEEEGDEAMSESDVADRLLDNPQDLVSGDWVCVIASRYDIDVPEVHIPEYRFDYYLGSDKDQHDSREYVFVEFTTLGTRVATVNGKPVWSQHEGLTNEIETLAKHPLKDKAVPYRQAYDNDLYLFYGRMRSTATDRDGRERYFEWQAHGFDTEQPHALEVDRQGNLLNTAAEMLEMATSPDYFEQHYVEHRTYGTYTVPHINHHFSYVYCPRRVQVLQYVRS